MSLRCPDYSALAFSRGSIHADYLPDSGTAQGAALDYFRSMSRDQVNLLGVRIIERDHPGSSYYAAELTGDIEQANQAAKTGGISVRFKLEAP